MTIFGIAPQSNGMTVKSNNLRAGSSMESRSLSLEIPEGIDPPVPQQPTPTAGVVRENHRPLLGIGRRKLILGGLAFVILTAGIFWYQVHQIQPGHALPRWGDLRWGYFLLMLVFLPVETVAAAMRIRVISRVLHPGIRLWSCAKAELSNVAISTLTPSQTGGGPAQIYILSREGMRAGTALTISLVSFMGTMTVLFMIGLYCLLLAGNLHLRLPFITAVWTLLLVACLMAFAAIRPAMLRIPLAAISRLFCKMWSGTQAVHDWWPPETKRTGPPVDRMGLLAGKLADLVYTYRRDLRRFLRCGRMEFLGVCLLSFLIFASRVLMPYFCLRFLGVETSTLRAVVEAQMALIFLIFFAPTPGAAGLAEGASMTIFEEIIPLGFVPAYHFLWRLSSVYLPAGVGLFCLLRALAADAKYVMVQPQPFFSTTQEPPNTSHNHNRRTRLP